MTDDGMGDDRYRLHLDLHPVVALPLAIGLVLAVTSSFLPNPTLEWLAAALVCLTFLIAQWLVLLVALRLLRLPTWTVVAIVISGVVVLSIFLVSVAGVIDGLFGTATLTYLSNLPVVRTLRPWYERYDTIMTFVDWLVLVGALIAYILSFGSKYGEGLVNDPVHGPGCNCGCGCAWLLYIAWIVAAGRVRELFQPVRDVIDLVRHIFA